MEQGGNHNANLKLLPKVSWEWSVINEIPAVRANTTLHTPVLVWELRTKKLWLVNEETMNIVLGVSCSVFYVPSFWLIIIRIIVETMLKIDTLQNYPYELQIKHVNRWCASNGERWNIRLLM